MIQRLGSGAPLIGALCLGLALAPAIAYERSPVIATRADSALPDSVVSDSAATDATTSELEKPVASPPTVHRVIGSVLVRYSQSLSGSIGGGLIVSDADPNDACNVLCDLRGPVVQLEAGRDGVQLAGGWGWVVAETTAGRRFVKRTHFGYAVKAVWLRTHSEGRLGAAHQGWAGVEGSVSAIGVHLSAALLRGKSSQDSKREWRVVGAVGWGF